MANPPNAKNFTFASDPLCCLWRREMVRTQLSYGPVQTTSGNCSVVPVTAASGIHELAIAFVRCAVSVARLRWRPSSDARPSGRYACPTPAVRGPSARWPVSAEAVVTAAAGLATRSGPRYVAIFANGELAFSGAKAISAARA